MFTIDLSLDIFLNIIRTAIDLVSVCLVLYYLISMFKTNMKTVQLFKGILAVLILKLLTSFFGLTTLNFLIDGVIDWGVLAIIIIFQPEIRTLLEKMGQTKNENKKVFSNDEKERVMDELVNTIITLSKEQTGALITFERSQSLVDYINTGTKVNADIKSELLLSIFYEGTPLHDGATIIQGDKIVCAAAFYPPTNQELSPRYGARHRAALGISEISDSLTVVVSEETGTISFAVNGVLKKIPAKELRASLVNELQWFKLEKKEDADHE